MKKKAFYSCFLILTFLCIIMALPSTRSWAGEEYTASVMRILFQEGTVRLEEESGESRQVTEDLRLQSGNVLETEEESMVSVGLDEIKIVTLKEESEAKVKKAAKDLSIYLSKGNLFFQVLSPLPQDESFDIETSTMMVGIRGTSGYVMIGEEGRDRLIVTDGRVHVTGTHPVTGEVKEAEVHAGQRLTVYLYDDREVDSIVLYLEDLTLEEAPSAMLHWILSDEDRIGKVSADTGWTEDEMRQRMDQQRKQAATDYSRQVTIFVPSEGKMFDGTPLTGKLAPLITGLPDGYMAEVKTEGSQTETGRSANRVSSYIIRDESGEDVTERFPHVEVIEGTLSVMPAMRMERSDRPSFREPAEERQGDGTGSDGEGTGHSPFDIVRPTPAP